VQQELLTLPEFTPDFMEIHVAQFLVFWAYIKSSTAGATSVAETAYPSGTPVFSSFYHNIVCPFSIYGL
jgi:hypothetical protein